MTLYFTLLKCSFITISHMYLLTRRQTLPPFPLSFPSPGFHRHRWRCQNWIQRATDTGGDNNPPIPLRRSVFPVKRRHRPCTFIRLPPSCMSLLYLTRLDSSPPRNAYPSMPYGDSQRHSGTHSSVQSTYPSVSPLKSHP